MGLFSSRLKLIRPKRPRLGFPENLLTRPLVRGIEQVGARADVVDIPDDMVPGALASGDLDIALVPSLEVVAHPEYLILPTICVGTFGGGRMAVLCSKVLPTEIQSILVSPESQVFSPLLEILLPRQVMIRPQLVRAETGTDQALYDFQGDPSQAILFTGAAAMQAPYENFSWTWDLMQAWKNYTSLPFVLWVWAVRPNVDLQGLDGELNSVLVGNLSRLDDMAAEQAKASGIEEGLLKLVYAKIMHYTLDNPFMAGLRRYAKEVADAGLTPGKALIRLYSSK